MPPAKRMEAFSRLSWKGRAPTQKPEHGSAGQSRKDGKQNKSYSGKAESFSGTKPLKSGVFRVFSISQEHMKAKKKGRKRPQMHSLIISENQKTGITSRRAARAV
jgi:hypothetical protein